MSDAAMNDLRTEVALLLAAALANEERHDAEIRALGERHDAEIKRRDVLHVEETGRRDQLHIDELQRRSDLHGHELELIRAALDTRDVIGQAKGVIMATMHVSADEAFDLLRKQSAHENIKLVDVAIEVANRASRRPPAG